MILQEPNLKELLSNSNIFIDTNVFSAAFRDEEFFNWLFDIRGEGRSLLTIESVLFEVTKGSTDLDTYNGRREVVQGLVDKIVPLENWMNSIDEFTLVMAKQPKPTKEYTDFLLAACLYKYGDNIITNYLLTSDQKALPVSLFKREAVVTLANDTQITNFCLYSFNSIAFIKAAEKILQAGP